ncbi:MAG: YihY/virulence factor BrkB family protein [Planctomycetes bacterium]|nr:YihY/virulence factor BrkB family protein [Planctomycetota bacterium]
MRVPRASLGRRVRRYLGRFATYVWVSVRRYLDDQGSLRAGGLTYLTLMSLVPGLTVVLLIASAFGVKEQFRSWVDSQSVGWSEQLVQIKDTVLEVVDNVRLELLGGFGLLAFIWVVLSLLAKVENALNETWNAGKSRTLARRYADYVAILFFVPLLVLAATGLKTIVTFDGIVGAIPMLGPVVESGLQLLPIAMIWLALTLVYKVMPNVTVGWGPALFSGLIAGTSWYVAQAVFFRAQIGLSRQNAIYGSLALLPFFLFYLYVSWAIVLWGAEFCYVFQNRITKRHDAVDHSWTPDQRHRLAIGLVRGAVDQFKDGKSLMIADFAGSYRWPRRRVDEIAKTLVEAGILHFVHHGKSVVPAKPPDATRVADIILVVDGVPTSTDVMTVDRPLPAREDAILQDLRQRIRDLDGML